MDETEFFFGIKTTSSFIEHTKRNEIMPNFEEVEIRC